MPYSPESDLQELERAPRQVSFRERFFQGRYRHLVAVVIVIAATVLRLEFLQGLGMHVAFLTFFPAVMLAAL
jgi:hypothetical protein